MAFKNVLPYEKYVLTTRLSVTEVVSRISDSIQPKQRHSFSILSPTYAKPYTGEIRDTTFTMTRNINYRNSFLPVITGEITTYLGLTQVQIKMQPVTFVLIFVSFWLGTVGLICVGMLLAALLHLRELLQTGFSPMLLIPFGMFAFGCLLTYFAFKSESKKSKEFLSTLLNGTDG